MLEMTWQVCLLDSTDGRALQKKGHLWVARCKLNTKGGRHSAARREEIADAPKNWIILSSGCSRCASRYAFDLLPLPRGKHALNLIRAIAEHQDSTSVGGGQLCLDFDVLAIT